MSEKAEKMARTVASERAVKKSDKRPKSLPKAQPGEVTLLSGGNPQIAKGYGDAPVQSYIAAMPGWKSDVGRSLDAIIEQTVPGVRKAVKWNSPVGFHSELSRLDA